MKKRGSHGHQHAWVLLSSHSFARTLKYRCTSCSEILEIKQGV